MKRIYVLFAMFLFALVSCSEDNSTEPAKDEIKASVLKPNDLVPLSIGNEWTYNFIEYDDNGNFVAKRENASVVKIISSEGVQGFDVYDEGIKSAEVFVLQISQNYPEFFQVNSFCALVVDDYYDDFNNQDDEPLSCYQSYNYKGKANIIINGKNYNDCDKYVDVDDDARHETYFKKGIGIIKEIKYFENKIDYIKELTACSLK